MGTRIALAALRRCISWSTLNELVDNRIIHFATNVAPSRQNFHRELLSCLSLPRGVNEDEYSTKEPYGRRKERKKKRKIKTEEINLFVVRMMP